MDGVCGDCSGSSVNYMIMLLHCAVNGHMNCMKELIEAGAGVNSGTPSAAKSSEAGVCVSKKCDGSKTGTDMNRRTCMSMNRADTKQIGADVNKTPADVNKTPADVNKTPADVNGEVKSDDFDPHQSATRKTSYTPLTSASEFGHTDCVKLLIQKGADVDKQNAAGDTAVMIASAKGHPDCVSVLIEAGADVNITNNSHYTALFDAALNQHLQCMDLLVKAGADVNCEEGSEPIMAAIFTGQVDCVDLLIKAGADVNISSKWVTKFPRYDVQHGYPKYGHHSDKILVHTETICNYTCTTPINDAIRFGHVECLDLLMKAGAGLNLGESEKEIINEALIFAVKVSSVKCVNFLIKQGADVNVASDHWMGSLLGLATHRNLQSAKLLLRAGAKINGKDQYGKNPLEGLFYHYRAPNKTMVLLLFAAGEAVEGRFFDWFDYDDNAISSVPVPGYLWCHLVDKSLKKRCRKTIREHLLKLDPRGNLFGRIPRIKLPKSLTDYLLYGQSVDDIDLTKVIEINHGF